MRKTRWDNPPGLFFWALLNSEFLILNYRITSSSELAAQGFYRSVKVSSIVICTETGWPMRVPGAKRH